MACLAGSSINNLRTHGHVLKDGFSGSGSGSIVFTRSVVEVFQGHVRLSSILPLINNEVLEP